jgi:hypothetical protein
MKKNFPLGNWFPAPVEIPTSKNSYESPTDRSSKKPSYHPLQVVSVPNEEGSTAQKVRVVYGAVNGVIPDEVDADLAEAEQFSVSNGDALYLKATINDSQSEVTSVSITKTKPTTSLTTAYLTMAFIYIREGNMTIAQITSGSQYVSSCGYSHYWTRV